MTWLPFLYEIFKVCILPLLGLLTAYAIKWVQSKEEEINNKIDNENLEHYVSLLSLTIQDCVAATSQTYVESLKAAGKFDAEAQKVAFEKTFNAVMGILTEDAKEYLGYVYGDLTVYLTNKIEAEVKLQK